jgi:hypothetical protein
MDMVLNSLILVGGSGVVGLGVGRGVGGLGVCT